MKKINNLEKKVKIYDIAFSIFTVILGGAFIWQVLDLYFSRKMLDEIFTRQIVAERLNLLLIPIIVWSVTAVAGFIIHEFVPKRKQPVKTDNSYILNNLKNRMPETAKQGLEVEYELVKSEERKIKYMRLACLLYVVVVVIYGIIYFLIPSNFTGLENATKEVVNMLKYVFPFVAIGFILCIIATVYEEISAKKQLSAVKKLIVNEKEKDIKAKSNEKAVFIARIALLVIGISFVITGIFNGSMHDVFVKAVNICTECIGLG